LIVLPTKFTLRLLVGVEKGIVVLAFDHALGDPIFEAFEVNVLHSAETFTETHKGIVVVAGIFKADPTYFLLIANPTFL
jgi:hypothetical protein